MTVHAFGPAFDPLAYDVGDVELVQVTTDSIGEEFIWGGNESAFLFILMFLLEAHRNLA